MGSYILLLLPKNIPPIDGSCYSIIELSSLQKNIFICRKVLIICKECTKIMKTEIYKVTKKNEYHRTMWCGTVDAKSEVNTVSNCLVA